MGTQPQTELQRLIDERTVRVTNLYYIGKAADGEEVIVGSVGNEQATNRYLAENGPENW